MRSLQVSLLLFLTSQLSTPTTAVPISSAPSTSPALLAPRADNCYNAPSTQAGTPLRRALANFRDPPSITWCDLHSSTYLIITTSHVLLEDSVSRILDDASLFVTQMIARGGDGLIPRGFWTLEEYGLQLGFENAANHQQTWGVVGAALVALLDYFVYRVQVGSVRAIQFQVWDGKNQVGTGYLKG